MAGNDRVDDCPSWDPNGPVPFRRWTRELMAWLNMTSRRMGPPSQAAAIQLSLRGVARELAMNIPPQYIQFGTQINGIPTDPVTYILYILGNRYENTEDERAATDSTMLIDFAMRPGERIDNVLARWDMARHRAARVGVGIDNILTLSMLLF